MPHSCGALHRQPGRPPRPHRGAEPHPGEARSSGRRRSKPRPGTGTWRSVVLLCTLQPGGPRPAAPPRRCRPPTSRWRRAWRGTLSTIPRPRSWPAAASTWPAGRSGSPATAPPPPMCQLPCCAPALRVILTVHCTLAPPPHDAFSSAPAAPGFANGMRQCIMAGLRAPAVQRGSVRRAGRRDGHPGGVEQQATHCALLRTLRTEVLAAGRHETLRLGTERRGRRSWHPRCIHGAVLAGGSLA